MKIVNALIGGIMILLGLFVLFSASQMIIHAFRGISGMIQGALIIAVGVVLCFYGYKRVRKE